MKEPYSDDTNTSGIRLTPYAELAALVQEADAAGLQVFDYCCGLILPSSTKQMTLILKKNCNFFSRPCLTLILS